MGVHPGSLVFTMIQQQQQQIQQQQIGRPRHNRDNHKYVGVRRMDNYFTLGSVPLR